MKTGTLAIAALLCLGACDEDGPVADAEIGGELCYDGHDNDGDGSFDCDDEGCQDLYSCCVGSMREGCCAPPQTHVDIDFSACADGEAVEVCEPRLGVFGSPRIEEGGFAPGGTVIDAGAWWPEPFDPSTSILTAEFSAAARTTDCTGGCVDAAGVAFQTDEPSAGTTRVSATAGLILSASRRELTLIVARTVVWSMAVTDDEFHRWRLTLRPDGGVKVHELDAEGTATKLTEASFSPRDRAWLVMYGRTPAPDPLTAPTRLQVVSVSRSFCDMPTASVAEADPLLPAPDATWPIGRASIESAGFGRTASGLERLAFTLDNAIHMSGPAAVGFEPMETYPDSSFEAPVFAPGGIADPSLVADEAAGRWILYFSVYDDDGVGSIAQVLGGAEFADSFDHATARIVASGRDGMRSLDQPTVYGDLMVTRATTSADLTSLVVLRRAPGAEEFLFETESADSAQIRLPSYGVFAAFDRDEVGQPALSHQYGVYRLLLNGRRGTRWHIGMMVSDDGIWWRDPLDGEELLETSDGGFDALGMKDPSIVADDGGLTSFYVGTDGAYSNVGRFRAGGWATWPLP